MSGIIGLAHSRAPAVPPPVTVDGGRSVEGYIIGCDLGQANDFTALSILEKHRDSTTEVKQKGFEPPTSVTTTRNVFHLRHLQRLKLGTSYPDVCNIVGIMLRALPAAKLAPALVIDKTGVGAPISTSCRRPASSQSLSR
jgi:hypothetical protein